MKRSILAKLFIFQSFEIFLRTLDKTQWALIVQNVNRAEIHHKLWFQVMKNRFSGDLGTMPLYFNRPTLTFSKKIFQKDRTSMRRTKKETEPSTKPSPGIIINEDYNDDQLSWSKVFYFLHSRELLNETITLCHFVSLIFFTIVCPMSVEHLLNHGALQQAWIAALDPKLGCYVVMSCLNHKWPNYL